MAILLFSFSRFKRNYFAVWGLIHIGLLLILTFFGHKITPDSSENANRQNISLRFKKPGYRYYSKDKQSEFTFYLGADGLGRDVLSRLIIGTKISMQVGFIAVFISLLIGVFTGSAAGYYGGWADKIILWLMNVFWSIPTILLAMVLLMSSKLESRNQLWLIFLAVGLTMWVDTARLIRGLFLQLREKEFVEASKALGYSDARIIWRHILPNTFPTLIVITLSNFASAILMESGLSYLGLGVQPPAPSWGAMLREYYSYLGTDVSYLAFFPGMTISLTVLAFYAVGNGLRDGMDVKY